MYVTWWRWRVAPEDHNLEELFCFLRLLAVVSILLLKLHLKLDTFWTVVARLGCPGRYLWGLSEVYNLPFMRGYRYQLGMSFRELGGVFAPLVLINKWKAHWNWWLKRSYFQGRKVPLVYNFKKMFSAAGGCCLPQTPLSMWPQYISTATIGPIGALSLLVGGPSQGISLCGGGPSEFYYVIQISSGDGSLSLLLLAMFALNRFL